MGTSAAAAEIMAEQVVIIVINRCCLPSNFRQLLWFRTPLDCGAFPGHSVQAHLSIRGYLCSL